MENELSVNVDQITVIQGAIEFHEFEKIKCQASELAAHVGNIEVNEENLKDSKKLLATVNKKLKELEDRRIAVKNHMLEPYQLFESQVKEIVNIVKEADEIVRQQIRSLEESERQQKEDRLKELYNKRSKHYNFHSLFDFKDFLKPRHLNKTTTIESIETEMVDFLEKVSTDLKVIVNMPNSEEILSAYIQMKDLARALDHSNKQRQLRDKIEASDAIREKNYGFVTYTISVFNEKDYKLLELFMKQNNIEFTMKEGY